MTDIAVLVGLLIALAGVIAYTGDVLGSVVGKRRLSLFGARPKQSGRIIGVLAGILIMLVTLATLALSFRNAVRVIMSAQTVGEQLAEQEVQLRRFTAQVERLQDQVEARTRELAEAQTEVATAERARDEAGEAVSELQTTQEELQSNVETLNERVTTLNTSLTSAQKDVAEAEKSLAQARRQFEEADRARQQAVAEADNANEEAAAVRQEVESLTADVAAAQEQLEIVQGELSQSRQELETARRDLNSTQTQLTDAQADLKNAQSELELANRARDEAIQRQEEAEARASTLQATIDNLEQQAEQLSTQNSELRADSDELVQVNQELLGLNRRLRDQTEALNTQLQSLQSTNETLLQDLEQQTEELARTKAEAEAVNSRNISYDINQVIHSGVITAQEPTAIRAQLAQLLQAASEKAVLRGGLDVVLTPEQSGSIVEEAAQTPGEDIVVLRSRMNQYISAPVLVAVEVAPNQKLVDDGQLVVSRQIHLGTGSRDNVRDDLRKILTDANAKLLGLGLSDEIYPSLSETSLEVEGFTNQLLRLKGPVTVGLAASDPIFAGGPAKLEFIILN